MDKNKTGDINNSNVDNPLLHFDALAAGIKMGGLRSVSAINLLVSYIVANLSNKVKANTIVLAMDESGLANHFEVSDAIGRLLKNGVIVEIEDGTLKLGNTTNADIELVEMDLPLTVRDKSIELCNKILAKEQFKRENKAEIVEAENGFEVVLCVSDNNTDFKRLNRYAATREQAEVIKEKFISNPVAVYEKLIDSIFENEQ